MSSGVALQKKTSPEFQVHVEVETCENLRSSAAESGVTGSAKKSKPPSYASGGQYGFVDKVVDGVTVTVNSVILTMRSRVFTASFQVGEPKKLLGQLKYDYFVVYIG